MVQDTAKVLLRNVNPPYNAVDSVKAKLNSSGTGSFNFRNAQNNINYYLVVTHRNCLETWSSSGVAVTQGGIFSYDFTSSASQAFGNNLILKSGRYCTYSGDINSDGAIDGTDGGAVDNGAYNYVSGYSALDINGDNYVDASDMSVVDNNSANFVGVIRP
jgi:hypothetical protein